MLFDEQIELSQVVQVTAQGITAASLSQIRGALIRRFKDVFGSDIDLSTATADGVLVNDLSLLLYNMAATLQAIYSNTDIKQAQGSYLDSIGAIANVFRHRATRSYVYLSMTYTGEADATYTANQLSVIDQNGTVWMPERSVTFTLPSGSGERTVTQTVKYLCSASGAVAAPANWLTSLVNVALPITFTQTSAAITGQNAEDDVSYRSRIVMSAGGTGLTVLENLVRALKSIEGVEDVYIYNNNTASPASAEETDVEIDAHSIYPVIRLAPGVTVTDETIGKTIYDNLTPGIATSDIDAYSEYILPLGALHSYVYNLASVGADTPIGTENVTIYWKQAARQPDDTTFEITPRTLNGRSLFNEEEIPQIAQTLINELNALPINTWVTDDMFTAMIIAADPLYGGNRTYTVQPVSGAFMTPEDNFIAFNDYTATWDSTHSRWQITLKWTEA